MYITSVDTSLQKLQLKLKSDSKTFPFLLSRSLKTVQKSFVYIENCPDISFSASFFGFPRGGGGGGGGEGEQRQSLSRGKCTGKRGRKTERKTRIPGFIRFWVYFLEAFIAPVLPHVSSLFLSIMPSQTQAWEILFRALSYAISKSPLIDK